MHEMGEIKRAQEQRIDVSVKKSREKSRDKSAAHFPIAANARTGEFCELLWRFSRCGIKFLWKIVSFPVSLW